MGSGANTELGLSFTAPDHIGKCQEFVLSYASRHASPHSFSHAIRLIQAPETTSEIEIPFLEWEGPKTILSRSLSELMDAREYPYNWEIPSEDRAHHQHKFHAALSLISEHLPITGSSIQKLIFSYLFAMRSGYQGGSVSSRIGMIWLAPAPGWETHLWAENIVHEFVHNALFLEDMVFNIFPYGANEMAVPEACVLSAIRKTKRGYDKSFHSAFVAIAIIQFYQKLGLAYKADLLIVPLIHCVDDLISKPQYLSEHGRVLLDELVSATVNLSKHLPTITYRSSRSAPAVGLALR